jgi:cytidylate kinase
MGHECPRWRSRRSFPSWESPCCRRQSGARDARDAQRSTAPLKAAADAVLLDTTDLDADAAFAAARAVIDRARPH